MDALINLVILLLPGGVAAYLHQKWKITEEKCPVPFLWAIYAFVIDLILCTVKLLRGWGTWSAAESWSTINSFTLYGFLGLLLSVLLPGLLLRAVKSFRSRVNTGEKTDSSAPEGQTELRAARDDAALPAEKGRVRDVFRLNISAASVTRAAALLLAVLAAASFLLVLVSAIPDKTIDANIAASSEKMAKEGKYPHLVSDPIYFQVDNWTEGALLNMLYNGDSSSPLESAFVQKEYWPDEGDKSGVGRLAAMINGGTEENGYYMTRSTYWLGMRILLLPLLSLMDYYTIRPIFFFVNLLLLALCTLSISRWFGTKTAMLYFASLLMLNWYVPMTLWCNGAFCLWICTAAIGVLLKKFEKLSLFCLFLVTGAVTNYLDWFSAPLITFGFPAIIAVLYLAAKEKRTGTVQYLNLLFRCGLGWCAGYGGMMAGRVLITTIVGGEASLANFLERATYNITSSGQAGGGFGEKWETILHGFHGVFPLAEASDPVVAAVLIVGLLATGAAVLCLRKKRPHLVPLYLISLSPFLWFIVFNGYCRVHFWIAFRVFSVTVFAWLLIAVSTLEVLRDGKRKLVGGNCRAQL